MKTQKTNKSRQLLLETIVFFSQKRKIKNPSKMMIYKLIAEFDFRHFQETGLPVTSQRYEAYQWGPVPQPFHDEITVGNELILPKDFVDSINIQDSSFEDDYGKIHRAYRFIAKRKPNLNIFSPRQLRILSEIADIYKYTTATEASLASHERGKPWTITVAKKGEHAIIDLLDTIELNKPLNKEIVSEYLKEKRALDYNYGA